MWREKKNSKTIFQLFGCYVREHNESAKDYYLKQFQIKRI